MMLEYRIRIDGVDVGLEAIGDPQIMEMTSRFAEALDRQLGPATCEVHRRPPMVMLSFEQGTLQGWGFGSCCKEFADLLVETVKGIDLPYVKSQPLITTRIVKYVGQS
jgi:hypothetical protein